MQQKSPKTPEKVEKSSAVKQRGRERKGPPEIIRKFRCPMEGTEHHFGLFLEQDFGAISGGPLFSRPLWFTAEISPKLDLWGDFFYFLGVLSGNFFRTTTKRLFFGDFLLDFGPGDSSKWVLKSQVFSSKVSFTREFVPVVFGSEVSEAIPTIEMEMSDIPTKYMESIVITFLIAESGECTPKAE